jgi:hypothetical protein
VSKQNDHRGRKVVQAGDLKTSGARGPKVGQEDRPSIVAKGIDARAPRLKAILLPKP